MFCVTENGGGGGESHVRVTLCCHVPSCVMRRVTENGGGGGESRVRVTSCCHVASCVMLQRTAAVVVRVAYV